MKVKCISGCRSLSLNASFLTHGKVYQVISENKTHYKLIDDTNREVGWIKERFEVVEEGGTAFPSEKTILQIGKIQGDAEEERCWQAMRPRVDPGHCVCGIPKQLCDYHRE